ncbi:arabinogalactan protein 41-like [Rhododendron vialii]|uniref:arabinogalactan protein 41-like n=1 Tax=Rhododendron vialii TaxID=182163 RepID=UPI00265E3F1D|nr:arabinogalactan protein 41-like [Rhododendron vialii]
MAVPRVFVGVLTVFAIAVAVFSRSAEAEHIAPAPAPASDGTSIDQGIAYALMLVALVLTYLIHPLDASSNNFF